MHRCIDGVNGACEGMVFKIKGRVTIGRSADNTVQVVDDRDMSRHHACVRENKDGDVVLEDLGSRNGTFLGVGRHRVNRVHKLQPGDSFRVGETRFVYAQLSNVEYDRILERQVLKVGGGSARTHSLTSVSTRVVECPHPSHRAMDRRYRFCPVCGRKLH